MDWRKCGDNRWRKRLCREYRTNRLPNLSKAQFKRLQSSDGTVDVDTNSNTIDFTEAGISYRWTGENVGSSSDTITVYKDGTGPSATPSSNAQFRKLKSNSVEATTPYDPLGENSKLTIQVDGDDNVEFAIDLSDLTNLKCLSGYGEGGSPASGSINIGGIKNSISGYYNIISAGSGNTISGGEFNFIGGGSGNDVNWSKLFFSWR